MKPTKTDIIDGPIDDLTEEDFAEKNVKVRISMYVDLDIVRHFKAEAARTGDKYQTLMNRKLREATFGGGDIEKRLASVEERLSKEELLLRAIFGEDKVEVVRPSVRLPSGQRMMTKQLPRKRKKAAVGR